MVQIPLAPPEKDDEVFNQTGASVDFGGRVFDTRLPVWWSTDPKAAKYPFFAPYVAFGNNPIYYIDPQGETLRVAGTEESIRKYETMLNKSFAGKVTAKVTDGVMKITRFPDKGDLTDEENALFKTYQTAITHEKTILQTVLSGKDPERNKVVVGDWNTGALDIDDAEKLGYTTGEFISVQGAFAHELSEQTEKQTGTDPPSQDFDFAHDFKAIPAENAAGGIQKNSTDKLSPGLLNPKQGAPLTGTATSFFITKNGVNSQSVMSVENGNVTDVSTCRDDCK